MLVPNSSIAGNAMAINVSNHKALGTYYAAPTIYQSRDVIYQQATRLAFSTLLDILSKTAGWTLISHHTGCMSIRRMAD